jgi:hypothetical protein
VQWFRWNDARFSKSNRRFARSSSFEIVELLPDQFFHRGVSMKKLLCLALVALASLPPIFSQSSPISIRALGSVDFGGKLGTYATDVKGGDDQDYETKLGFDAGAEVLYSVSKGVQLGAGAGYLFGREVDDADVSGKFGFIPVYGLAKFGVDLGLVKPYALGRVGYDFLTGDDDYKDGVDLKGGLCYFLGGGIEIGIPNTPVGAFVEAGYSVNRGEVKGDAVDAKIQYKRLQTSLGLSFSL